MCLWNVLSTLLIVLSVIQLTTDAVCLSKEQFLASLDRTKTLVFEATLIQHTTNSPLPDGFEAYVEIRRIVQQPQVGWQLTPGSVAHIRNIRPREVDHSLCLPIVRNGEVYLWVTWNTAEDTQTREEGSLQFYPGGLFRSETSITDPRWAGDKMNPAHVDTSINDRLLHDAAYVQPTPSNNFPPGGNTLARDPYNVLNVCDLAPCPMELNPTCGSDGVLYQNECMLRQRACIARQMSQFQDMRQMPISIDYTNLCMDRYEIGMIRQDVVLCESNNLCAYGSLCAAVSSTAMGDDQIFPCDCRLMSCVGEFPGRPVCATDGQTYDNECALRKSMCKTQVVKRVLHTGNCTSNPCLGYMCRWPGERCEVDQTGQPKCVCPDPCPKVVLPVCGSDGMTYDSHCHLERTACLKMRHIWVVYAGPCSEEPQCQALGLHCQGYEVCTRVKAPQVYRRHTPFYYDSNALMKAANSQPIVPRCMCPLCPERGLGEKVCGTDGRTYRSECHLRSSACQNQLYEVKVRSRGPCNACNSKECKYYAICQRNLDGEPQCICPTGCPAVGVDQSVCGTDGQTYESECHLKVRSCAEQRDLYVAHHGPCKTCPAGCPLGYQCRNGECVCRDTCPPSTGLVPEVCGTDGQLYRSECELKRQACLLQTEVHVDASGMKCQGRTHDSASPVQSDENQSTACNCNKLGALSEHCDHTGQCECKQGARGTRCDQCMPDYWGIQNGHECIACSCHPDGSVSTTCDPTTGQCECRAGIFGRQCSICADGGRVTKAGCVKTETQPGPKNELHRDVPSRGSVQVNEPQLESDQTTTTGRQFDPRTTLLVRAPVTLEQPVLVELHLMVRLLLDGSLLEYRVTPTEQEQMWVENLQDHQFSLFLVDGGFVECK
ncbi:hypothetical protein EG68_03720 [Paragonimus skrjabini miyazakii]|uniref:Agrin n=1 Tax=Paragonimus skrjabini miyazakii TaxID=59628 RepID=A0A8S9YBW6_9TREM|nr:hypothetical protein EG68_03720 [Paragonimus skrjabini miyazakii]